jgi:class 3 adenylate cyclase
MGTLQPVPETSYAPCGDLSLASQSHRALRTVLFTDMVASTQRAAAAGDERWRAVLHRFGEITAELTQRFGGMVVKSTGDGHLTTFDGPTQAIRCAEALPPDAETLGIQIAPRPGRRPQPNSYRNKVALVVGC